MSQLREDCCTALCTTTGRSLRDLPHGDVAIVVSAQKELRVIPRAAFNARDRLPMTLVFVAFEQHRTVNFQVPQADGSLLVTSSDQAALL